MLADPGSEDLCRSLASNKTSNGPSVSGTRAGLHIWPREPDSFFLCFAKPAKEKIMSLTCKTIA